METNPHHDVPLPGEFFLHQAMGFALNLFVPFVPLRGCFNCFFRDEWFHRQTKRAGLDLFVLFVPLRGCFNCCF